MTRPVWLRSRTWNFVITRLLCHDRAQLRGLQAKLHVKSVWPLLTDGWRFGALFTTLGAQKRPDLLQQTVIQFENGVEYLVPLKAARALAGRAQLHLYRLYDSKEIAVSPAAVRRAIASGGVFDQLNR